MRQPDQIRPDQTTSREFYDVLLSPHTDVNNGSPSTNTMETLNFM